ncbi:MAG: NAD-dependent epimerase/dehydratase family protein [Treponema sp.]|uniref:NAD-dependent epimerase/dehydratase family protein n=1 Tax=Treponema sp. TaxID=166 RepID=UPI0025F410D3|nr:NAD-dependent epimerase/dehydratase family protein [Treponema sp.]MBQ8680490.1 NAD-dependent epimerase/dehydratase family protein [Treponema sp.]MBR1639709.1 NAD-dependent epimerase/dehydratase family protein [Treponema sp.]
MLLTKSELYIKDINNIIKSFDFMNLKNKKIFITGCNGLICSAIVDLLWMLNKSENLNISLFLASRNVEKTKKRFHFTSENNVILVPYDATVPFINNYNCDYYILGASNASPELFIKEPVQTMNSNLFGLQEILKSCIKTNAKILYISSSEVYGRITKKTPLKEKDYGFMDILNPRSSYGMSKRAAETLCTSYTTQYGLNIVIARPGHIYGPTASKNDKRVSSSFMFDAAEGKNLILKSKGEQIRSYTYCLDCASALLFILIYGKTGEAYNVSNPHSICTIADMASYYAKYAGTQLYFELPKENEVLTFNPMKNSSLNSIKLEALGWKALLSKEEGFEHSIYITKDIISIC